MGDIPWWKTTTIYQIYPRSYKDSNGDGIGDLRGIISKLDYIRKLGFETVWLSPFFDSPQEDFGYDIRDYLNIAPEYGTLKDAEDLIAEIHTRGMRVIFDLVMNHTSAQHPWFQASRQNRENPYRDWYIWKTGRGKHPPNNWQSMTGGSGWNFDESSREWYYASFLPFQPDLNYRNPEVRQTMLQIARHWLNKGVDGFRLDIFHTVYKDARFRDNPFSLHYIPYRDRAGFFQRWLHHQHQPETFALARDLRQIATSYSDERMLIGEVFGEDEVLKQYLGTQADGLNLVFSWELLKTRPRAQFFRDVIAHHEREYPEPYTPVYVYGNHDQKRICSKVGTDPRIAQLLALIQFTVRGIPVVYYGEEIGMQDVAIPAKRAKDPLAHQYAWVPAWLADVLRLYVNRDGCRTPMQWDFSPNAGFAPESAQPWLPVHENNQHVNVQAQQGEPDSLLETYRTLLRLRRQNEVFQHGSLRLWDAEEGKDVLAYERILDAERVVVAINWGGKAVNFPLLKHSEKILFTIGDIQTETGFLLPLSGVMIKT